MHACIDLLDSIRAARNCSICASTHVAALRG